MKKSKFKLMLLATATTITLMGPAAFAQTSSEPNPATEESDEGIKEIIVTATRRETALDSTPLAVTQLSAEQLAQSDIRSVDSLQFFVPGLVSGNGTAFTTIRGVGTSQLGSVVEGGVATNVDGVFIGRASAVQTYFDLDSVEVLRGPQGTLYGRNATGGVINLNSARPTDKFEAAFTGLVGNYDRRRLEGMVSGPLDGGFSARFAMVSDRRSSYLKNIVPGGPKVRDDDVLGARGSLRYKPSEDGPVFDLILDYTRIDGAGNLPQFISGTIAASAPAPRLITTDPDEVTLGIDARSKREYFGANFTASIPIGDLTVRSITGYRTSQRNTLSNNMATSDPRSFTITDEHANQFTQELQLLGPDDGSFQWVAGLYYFREQVRGDYTTKAFLADVPLLVIFGIDPTNFTLFPWRYEEFLPQHFTSQSWAAYAQGTYSLTDQLRVTVGARYTRDKKVGTGGAADARLVDLSGIFPNIPAGGGLASVDKSWGAFTPKVGVEFEVADGTMIYGSITRGYKPGNANLTFNSPLVTPEFLWAYESGLRARLFDNRAQLNVTGYVYDYKDMQVFSVVPGATTGSFSAAFINAASAKMKGIDVEFRAQPVRGLELNAAYGYLDAKYGDFISTDEFAKPNVFAVAAPQNVRGNTLQRAPKHTLNLGVQYTANIGNVQLIPRVEMSYRSEIFATQFNTASTVQSGYTLYNARFTLTSRSDVWRAAIFGNNLSNKRYFALVSEGTAGTANGVYGAPRTFGLEVSFKY